MLPEKFCDKRERKNGGVSGGNDEEVGATVCTYTVVCEIGDRLSAHGLFCQVW